MAAAVPPDPRPLLRSVDSRLADLRHARVDLEAGRGRYANTPEGEAARALARAQRGRHEAETFARMADIDWRSRRYWRRTAREWAAEEATAQERFERVSGPERERLEGRIAVLEQGRSELVRQVQDRVEWLSAHPEAERRLDHLDREIDRMTPRQDHGLDNSPFRELQHRTLTREPDLGAGLDLTP